MDVFVVDRVALVLVDARVIAQTPAMIMMTTTCSD